LGIKTHKFLFSGEKQMVRMRSSGVSKQSQGGQRYERNCTKDEGYGQQNEQRIREREET
jgi:hypothetical protein